MVKLKDGGPGWFLANAAKSDVDSPQALVTPSRHRVANISFKLSRLTNLSNH